VGIPLIYNSRGGLITHTRFFEIQRGEFINSINPPLTSPWRGTNYVSILSLCGGRARGNSGQRAAHNKAHLFRRAQIIVEYTLFVLEFSPFPSVGYSL